MGPDSRWAQQDMTTRIRQILRAVPPEQVYGTGRPFSTTYQIAIEFQRQFPAVSQIVAPTTGGEGEGPFALTTYIARWLPQEILRDPRCGIELRFLSPADMTTLAFNDNGRTMTATTNRAGWNGTMFRYIGGDGDEEP